MIRVVGTDPGTSSLDLLLLVDGQVADQVRLEPQTLQAGPEPLVALLRSWQPLDLIAGPSGYGLPLVSACHVTEREIDAMTLLRPDERGADLGVLGFRGWLRALAGSGLPVVFLPGGIHLPTIPAHRKWNTIDLGTADKVALAALALRVHARLCNCALADATFAIVELGAAFSAALVVREGRVVDASAGTRGPIGLRSSGAWDGEVAYWLSPLSKGDLFHGGLVDLGSEGQAAFGESLKKHVAGLQAVTRFERVYLSGSALAQSQYTAIATEALEPLADVVPLPPLPGAWVKHAAQGAALLADGLAGGSHADLVAALELRNASGTLWDWIRVRRPNGH